MRKLLSCIFIISIAFSCGSDEKTREEEELELQQMFAEIEAMAVSTTCEDPADWSFSANGYKACGGPIGYIAYPLEISDIFLQSIADY